MTTLPHLIEGHRPTGSVIDALMALDYAGYSQQLRPAIIEYHDRLHVLGAGHSHPTFAEASDRHTEELVDRALEEMATKGESHPEL